jgi:hypothetical protein
MLRKLDRLLIRVENLPGAVRYWRETLGVEVISQSPSSAQLKMCDDDAQIILHCDPNLPEQALYILVDDVRALYANRTESQLDFRSPPAKGARGYHAPVRDPFGTILLLADRSLESDATAADSDSLFAGTEIKHKPNRPLLGRIYEEVGRTADDLPYTVHFESFYEGYTREFADPKPDRAEVWRHLLTTRKAGQLPKLGAARSKPPEVSDDEKQLLRELLGSDIGKRDRLPYSDRFDELVSQFNQRRRRPHSPHLVWRMIATLAK